MRRTYDEIREGTIALVQLIGEQRLEIEQLRAEIRQLQSTPAKAS